MIASRIVFDGIVPLLTQTPPTRRPLDDRDPPPKLCRLDGRSLPRRARADHEQLVVEVGHLWVIRHRV